MMRPFGTFNFPYDVCFSGHKSSDVDQIAGEVKLHTDLHVTGVGPSLAFPLRHWTDEDVWKYTEDNKLPVDSLRYDAANRREWGGKHSNSDYFSVCIKCIDRRNKEASVYCPKKKMQVSNISAQIPYREPELNFYGDKK